VATVKITITIPEEQLAYARARKESFSGSVSGYFQYLIEKERRGDYGTPGHTAAVVATGKRIWKSAREPGGDTVVLESGKNGVVTALNYEEGTPLYQSIAKWTQAVQAGPYKTLWLVLPNEANDADLINFDVLRSSGTIPELRVCRLKDWRRAVK